MPKFISFIEDFMLVGHNIKSFDIPFINKVCADLGLPSIKNKLTDTLYLSKEKIPDHENYKLSTLCEYFGIDTSNAHHALFDCYMCNSLYHIPESVKLIVFICQSTIRLAKSRKCTLIMLNKPVLM